MINAISMLNLGKLSNVQQLTQVNSKTVSTSVEEKTLMPRINNTHMNVQDMAALIKQVNQSNVATTNQEVAKNPDVDRMAKVYIENAKRFLKDGIKNGECAAYKIIQDIAMGKIDLSEIKKAGNSKRYEVEGINGQKYSVEVRFLGGLVKVTGFTKDGFGMGTTMELEVAKALPKVYAQTK